MNFRRRLGGHLFFKIFFTYVLTTVAILGTVAAVFHVTRPEQNLAPMLEKNLAAYLRHLNGRLLSRPHPGVIMAIEQELDLRARVEGWEPLADASGLPRFEELRPHRREVFELVRMGRTDNYVFAELREQQRPRVVWFMPIQRLPMWMAFPVFALLGFLSTILVLSFLSIRWMMRPLKTVVMGVGKLASGDLKYRIDAAGRGHDRGEFGLLARTFNAMADRIETMINAKEQLLRDVSHELRSPLTRIAVASDLVGDEALRASLKEDVRKIDRLVSEILESYRLRDGAGKLRKSRTQLSELVKGVVEDYPGVRFVEPSGGEAWAEVDAMQIERVVRNLIENAMKYARPGTSPDIEARVIAESGGVGCRIEIEDQGVGIGPEDLARIFEPFYRVDKSRAHADVGGFGLGLSICKSIVEAHGGKLTARSELGRGSVFVVEVR